jgi:hypothetical protein
MGLLQTQPLARMGPKRHGKPQEAPELEAMKKSPCLQKNRGPPLMPDTASGRFKGMATP